MMTKDAVLIQSMRDKANAALVQSLHNANFHLTGIDLHDSYFIFYYGTNSIVHYRLKECPGWLFGVWWDEPTEGSTHLTGTWFTQYEETIDKFKPSRSEITASIDVDVVTETVSTAYLEQTAFIRDEPMRAFARDYCGYDVVSREEAEREFTQYKWRRDRRKQLQEEFVRKTLHVFREHFDKEVLNDCYVIERDHISPTYVIAQVVPDCEKDEMILWQDGCDNEDEKRTIQEELDAIELWLQGEEDRYHCYVIRDVDTWLLKTSTVPADAIPLSNF